MRALDRLRSSGGERAAREIDESGRARRPFAHNGALINSSYLLRLVASSFVESLREDQVPAAVSSSGGVKLVRHSTRVRLLLCYCVTGLEGLFSHVVGASVKREGAADTLGFSTGGTCERS